MTRLQGSKGLRALAAHVCTTAALLVALASAGGAAAQGPATPPATDSLRVVLCGTGGPLPIRDRAKSCVAIQAGGATYLVDAGPGSTQNLMLWRLPLATLKAVFITHLHSDHIGDLGEVNMQSWVAGRPAPLAVVGPPEVRGLAAGFNQAYEADHRFRNAHHAHGEVNLPIPLGLLAARPVTVGAGRDPDQPPVTALAWSEGALRVTAIAVQHSPVTPAYAYRFDYKGRSVVISGDTARFPPLAVAAKGADVLLHEAQNDAMTRMMVQGLKGLGQPRTASIMTDTLSYHTTPVEAAEIARAAGVKALVLTHLTQAGLPFFTPEAFTRGVGAAGVKDWRLAKDGMTIDLPVGSDAVTFGSF